MQIISRKHLSQALKKCLVFSNGLSVLLAAFCARADWPGTNVTKWVQYPDRNITGYDILAAQPAAGEPPIILADDFLCRKTGPISDIHIWASWLNDEYDPTLPITLGIWSDVPAITNGTLVIPSHPGSMLWSQTFNPGEYILKMWSTSNERFWSPDPLPDGTLLGVDHIIWQYNFYPIDAFVQEGTPKSPVIYWLSVTAGPRTAMFGWKTSTNHWNDDAVAGHLNAAGGPLGDWRELRDPSPTVNRSLDMSFAITTRETPPPPPPPQTNKWAQYPQMVLGYDVNISRPNIVADDFLCTSAGRITNIQAWASWKDDLTPDPNTRFVLGIWSDMPSSPTSPYSRPRTLLWTETFGPGSYSVAPAGQGDELFYDPTTGQLTPETRVWLYTFVPKQPFCQRGADGSPVVYWLSIWAQSSTPTGMVGWKTSTNHWHDDGVFGHLDAAGAAIGDWKDLSDPLTGISLDLAFVLHNGPVTPECNDRPTAKWRQLPDTSTDGIDVLANRPLILADDFLCKRTGPISGIRVWGSWLDDLVDTNVTFTLRLWTDVPAIPGTSQFSHPGELLCSTTFFPPTTVGTAPMRYNYGLAVDNLKESFMDPDLPPPTAFIGDDTQIWRYDFYPRLPCWTQRGTLSSPRVYWVSLTANTVATAGQFRFGWKTSTNHWNDDGVWGHLDANGNPLKDWKDLHDPRSNISLDLSFALRSFPIVGINKDLKNTLSTPVDGIQIVLNGLQEITWHFDDVPPWPNFSVTQSGGNTILEWSGKNVPSGAITHVGFEMRGTSISIATMRWLLAGAVVGTPIQINHHLWGNGTVLTLNNDFVREAVMANNGHVEFFAEPVPLDLMNPGSERIPILSATLPLSQMPILPGSPMRVQVPRAPPEARYALFVMDLANATGDQATMDFVQMPLDEALRPVVQPPMIHGSFFDVFWDVIPGRTYRVQTTRSLQNPSWMDMFVGDSEDADEMNVMLPMNGAENYIRVQLDPE